jgi:hypothetical protein
MIVVNAQSDFLNHAKAEMAHAADVAAERPTRFYTPTAGQVAVSDKLEDIGLLEGRHAHQVVMNRLAEVDQRLASGETAEQIAILFTLRDLVGVEENEMDAVYAYLKAKPVSLASAAREFSWRELEQVRAQC